MLTREKTHGWDINELLRCLHKGVDAYPDVRACVLCEFIFTNIEHMCVHIGYIYIYMYSLGKIYVGVVGAHMWGGANTLCAIAINIHES